MWNLCCRSRNVCESSTEWSEDRIYNSSDQSLITSCVFCHVRSYHVVSCRLFTCKQAGDKYWFISQIKFNKEYIKGSGCQSPVWGQLLVLFLWQLVTCCTLISSRTDCERDVSGCHSTWCHLTKQWKQRCPILSIIWNVLIKTCDLSLRYTSTSPCTSGWGHCQGTWTCGWARGH